MQKVQSQQHFKQSDKLASVFLPLLHKHLPWSTLATMNRTWNWKTHTPKDGNWFIDCWWLNIDAPSPPHHSVSGSREAVTGCMKRPKASKPTTSSVPIREKIQSVSRDSGIPQSVTHYCSKNQATTWLILKMTKDPSKPMYSDMKNIPIKLSTHHSFQWILMRNKLKHSVKIEYMTCWRSPLKTWLDLECKEPATITQASSTWLDTATYCWPP